MRFFIRNRKAEGTETEDSWVRNLPREHPSEEEMRTLHKTVTRRKLTRTIKHVEHSNDRDNTREVHTNPDQDTGHNKATS